MERRLSPPINVYSHTYILEIFLLKMRNLKEYILSVTEKIGYMNL